MQKQDQAEWILELNKILKKIGWSIAIPDVEAVDHMIIGKEEKVVAVTEKLPQAYDVMVPPKDQ